MNCKHCGKPIVEYEAEAGQGRYVGKMFPAFVIHEHRRIYCAYGPEKAEPA